jgi:hypothetical protein
MAQKTSWTAATATESDINTYLMHEGGAWTSWTPVVTQSNTPTLSNTRSRYGRAGRFIYGDAIVTLSSAGTAANAVVITVPVQMSSTNNNSVIGEGWITDTSAGFNYYGILARNTATTCVFIRRTDGAAAAALGASGFTAALASGDIITMQFKYEANS